MKKAFTLYDSVANYLVRIVLVLVPFSAFLTVWISAGVGHYTLLRLWDDTLAAILVIIVAIWVWREKPLRDWLSGSLLVRLIALYVVVTVLLGLVAYLKHDVTAKALAYGLLVNLRYLFWFLAIMVTAKRSNGLNQQWTRLLMVPAGVVVIFALLQFSVLPHNFLSHFGYNAATNIAPIETINHNSHYVRVQSTLRGANPLGAYLVVIATAAAVCLVVRKRRRMAYGVFGVATLAALYATGSRSAWIGAALALMVVAWLCLKTKRSRLIASGIGLGMLIVVLGIFVVFRNNTGVENTLLHTQKHSAVAASSNSAHASALKSGLTDVWHQPFGDGAGTAGPASVYNGAHGSRIAENYFVQIAQETGWLGLGLLLSIFALVGTELYRRARTSPLSLALFASLIGLTFVNLLSHAWVDNTLAYIWWGFAGVALARQKAPGHEI